MRSVEGIKAVIEEKVRGKYSLWMIGLTSDPREARRRNGNPLTWFTWEISEKPGFDMINFFHEKGMTLAAEMATKEATVLYITL